MPTPDELRDQRLAEEEDELNARERARGEERRRARLGRELDTVEKRLRHSAEGAALFADTLATVKKHHPFDSEWHAVLTTLFVFQAYAAGAMKEVFFIALGGAKGTGKSKLMRLVKLLVPEAIVFENVSVAAMARMHQPGRTVLMDEFDESASAEVKEMRDALIRGGNVRGGGGFVRWNPVTNKPEPFDAFGPRMVAFRGRIDDALKDRSFVVQTLKHRGFGDDGYRLVVDNMFQEVGDLPERFVRWRLRLVEAWRDFPDTKALYESAEFKAKAREVCELSDASRTLQLTLIALFVADLAGVDVVAHLRAANDIRAVGDDEMEEELTQVVEALRGMVKDMVDSDAVVRVPQEALRKKVNEARKAADLRPLGSGAFARLRQELGIKDSWLPPERRRVGGGHHPVVWRVPVNYMRLLLGEGGQGLAGLVGLVPERLGQQTVDETHETHETQRGRVEDGAVESADGALIVRDRESGTPVEELVRRYGSDACIKAGVVSKEARV